MEAPPVPHEIAKTALVPVTAEAFNIPKAIDMRSRLSLLVLCFAVLSFRPVFTLAQVTVSMEVNTLQDVRAISPYIYGTNGQPYSGVTAFRSGGNRLTGYNWENNASNAGADWYHSSDNYLTWIMNPPPTDENEPGLVVTRFHDDAQAIGAYSLATLQMAGYVAKDKNGTVDVSETAPSSRWAQVVNRKGSAYSLTPSTADGYVYTDELLNLLLNDYGSASGSGVKGYALDNEPALWFSTHPRIHPDKVGVQELLDRSIDLASTIKDMDPSAEVFGPALYGFWAYMTLQDAPDWAGNFDHNYDRFIDAYLDLMKVASDTAGRRLLDVLDVHWYPEPAGVYAGDTDAGAVDRRIQAVRSLWDSTYVEDSWIGQWYSPVAILEYLNKAIATYNPGTKLAVTEYDYGAPTHISGGIAQADALGVFGEENVYFASKWNTVSDYAQRAFEIYRDYDGEGGTFGDLHVHSDTQDHALSSIYAAVPSADGSKLHLMLINKSASQSVTADVQISSDRTYQSGDVWYFDGSGPTIQAGVPITSISGNLVSVVLQPHSVHHIVLSSSSATLPVAAFSGSPTSGLAPLDVDFTDASTGSPSSWSWDFGDGGTSTQQNPSHTYTDSGVYTVSLQVTNGDGSDSESKTGYIDVQSPFSEFYAQSESNVSGTQSGGFSATYSDDNTFEVLTEEETGGRPQSRTSLLDHRWTFDLSAGLSTLFHLSAFRDDNSDGDDFRFEYSTDNVTFQPLVTVSESTETPYQVSLASNPNGPVYVRVVDTNRNRGARSKDKVYVDHMYFETLSRKAAPVAEFSATPTSGGAPLVVQFTDRSAYTPTSWAWDFGDGDTSTEQHPSHTYATPGTYGVSLTASNSEGSDDEVKPGFVSVSLMPVIHVADIAVSRTGAKWVRGTAEVMIRDDSDDPVAGASVSGRFSDPNPAVFSATTNISGIASLESDRTKSPPSNWCFEVTSVSLAGAVYDAASNVVTMRCEDGSSSAPSMASASSGEPVLGLLENHPNPFNPATIVSFSLDRSRYVRLEIFDQMGRRVALLVDGNLEQGSHAVTWDASSQATGMYLYRLSADDFVTTRTMLLMK